MEHGWNTDEAQMENGAVDTTVTLDGRKGTQRTHEKLSPFLRSMCSFAANQCSVRVPSVANFWRYFALETCMGRNIIIANGREIEAQLPCTIEEFLLGQKLLPRSVVVEHNGEAVAPSEFAKRMLAVGDRLEIVKIVAGG